MTRFLGFLCQFMRDDVLIDKKVVHVSQEKIWGFSGR
jgi:hypothetical protein